MKIPRNILYACIDFISIVVHPLSKILNNNRIRILLYHRVYDLVGMGDSMVNLSVPPKVFAQQMAVLAQNGFNVITLEQLINYRDENRKPPPKTAIITFDDGYRDNHINAFPILERYNFKATFFVVTDYINDGIFQWLKLGEELLSHYQENKQYWLPLSERHIIDMSAQGACFGSHSSTHCSLSNVSEGRALKELNDSKEHLEKILSKPVRCFSYPYGKVNKSVKGLVKAIGYRAAVTTKEGGNTLRSDFFELRRTAIDGQDSPAKFKRKVEGAYDWWFRYLLPVIVSAQRTILRK